MFRSANALKIEALEGTIKRIKHSAAGVLTFKDIVTRSAAMERVIRLGEKAAQSNIPIIIEGESGVGKEVIARSIQGTGKRRGKPFVTVNCGAIPENLVESVLFGHEKGSFTGAADKHAGKFVEADGGTLFLDEIGDLPLAAQVKLLRAVQEGEIDPVGSRKTVKVDIRLISATHRNLIDHVSDGKFREDLYYRLNVFPIHVPPLRERREDIPWLVRHFVARFAAEEGRKNLKGVSRCGNVDADRPIAGRAMCGSLKTRFSGLSSCAKAPNCRPRTSRRSISQSSRIEDALTCANRITRFHA